MYHRFVLAFAFTTLVVSMPLFSGCTDECGCDYRYDECIEKAPPGASKDDCAREHDACWNACDQSSKADGETELQRR